MDKGTGENPPASGGRSDTFINGTQFEREDPGQRTVPAGSRDPQLLTLLLSEFLHLSSRLSHFPLSALGEIELTGLP